jgi:hypothetical protein
MMGEVLQVEGESLESRSRAVPKDRPDRARSFGAKSGPDADGCHEYKEDEDYRGDDDKRPKEPFPAAQARPAPAAALRLGFASDHPQSHVFIRITCIMDPALLRLFETSGRIPIANMSHKKYR